MIVLKPVQIHFSSFVFNHITISTSQIRFVLLKAYFGVILSGLDFREILIDRLQAILLVLPGSELDLREGVP